MKIIRCSLRKISSLMILGVLVGCVQSVTTVGLGNIDALPETPFTAYMYSAGMGESVRAVLLKNPQSDVEIVPYSVQISTGMLTLNQALSFMQGARGHKAISYQAVVYKGKTIAYLLSHSYSGNIFSRETAEVVLFERSGKIYFTLTHMNYD